jgi:hypothetical protein
VGKVHRVQTKTPKRQMATNDSKDDSNSSINSDSSISVEAAPSKGTHLEERHQQLKEWKEGILSTP